VSAAPAATQLVKIARISISILLACIHVKYKINITFQNFNSRRLHSMVRCVITRENIATCLSYESASDREPPFKAVTLQLIAGI